MVDATPGPSAQSMEDILASIRRIMRGPEDEPPAPIQPAAAEDEDDVLELGSPPSPVPDARPESLVSAPVAEASRQAMAPLDALAIDPDAAANTLDGLVRELLRPMLKAWLDANLPEVVERVVTREVARLGVR